MPKQSTVDFLDDEIGRLDAENKRLRRALEQIRDAPFSMVNDSESLRHSIRAIQNTADQALR